MPHGLPSHSIPCAACCTTHVFHETYTSSIFDDLPFSNDPVADIDAPAFRDDILPNSVASLSQIQVELASVELMCPYAPRLIRDKDRLCEMVSRCRGALSASRSFPVEILLQIFQWSLQPSWTPYDELERDVGCVLDIDDGPWLVSYVCHRWRTIAICNPSLWSSVHLDLVEWAGEKGHWPLLSLWLARAADRPLDVSFRAYIDWYDGSDAELIQTRKASWHAGLAVLVPSSPTWRKFTFKASWEFLGDLERLHAMPELTHFSVDLDIPNGRVWDDSDHPDPPLILRDIFSDCPRLRTVSLTQARYPYYLTFPFALSTVQIMEMSDRTAALQLVDKIQVYQNIERLTVKSIANGRDIRFAFKAVKDLAESIPRILPTSLIAPNLRYLRIPAGMLVAFSALQFSAPLLEDLHLESFVPKRQESHSVRTFFKNSSLRFKRFHLHISGDGYPHERGSLIPLLVRLPASLLELHLHESRSEPFVEMFKEHYQQLRNAQVRAALPDLELFMIHPQEGYSDTPFSLRVL